MKLLRVLQEHVFHRVGSAAPRSVDVRVIAATHRRLEAEVAAGRFREDLFYRLNVLRIEIPPLRARSADVAPLAPALLSRIAARLGRRDPGLGPEALAVLAGAPWPGNARELANVLERALVLREPGARGALTGDEIAGALGESARWASRAAGQRGCGTSARLDSGRRSPAARQGRGARARRDPRGVARGPGCEGARRQAARHQPADARQEAGGSRHRSLESARSRRRSRRRAVNLLCPACHTPLPDGGAAVVSCPGCSAEVDVTRAGTVAGRPRFVPEIDRTGTTVERLPGSPRASRAAAWARSIARPGSDGNDVAIKFLSPALAQNSDVVARFAREISTLARLDHPAIVRVRAHGAEDGIPWFAMDLVEGSDLRARLARGALAPAETVGDLRAVARGAGVRARRRRGAPRSQTGQSLAGADGARLADFGVARWDAEVLAGSDALTRLTETAAVIGTLPYMSPEQRRGGAVDRRSDSFSTGVMLYEARPARCHKARFRRRRRSIALTGARSIAWCRGCCTRIRRAVRRPPGEAAVSLAAALEPRAARAWRYAARTAVLAAVLAGAGAGGRALWRPPSAGRSSDRPVVIAVPKPIVSLPPPPAPMPPRRSPAPDAPPPLTKAAKKSAATFVNKKAHGASPSPFTKSKLVGSEPSMKSAPAPRVPDDLSKRE